MDRSRPIIRNDNCCLSPGSSGSASPQWPGFDAASHCATRSAGILWYRYTGTTGTGTSSGHNDSTWVHFHLLLPNRQFTMYQEGLRSRRSLGRGMPSSDEKRQAQQVARRLKARQLKIQTHLEKLPGAHQPATTIARPTPRDYSPPAALTLVPFRQSLT